MRNEALIGEPAAHVPWLRLTDSFELIPDSFGLIPDSFELIPEQLVTFYG